jgi:asparagine synthase (glutamine-hydrolysing)
LVASHLSSGIDSSAVSATAAMLLAKTSERLLAFTSAPRAGFDGAVPKGRIADESGIAALTAARHPNIDHVVLRSEPRSLVDLLDQTHAFTQHTTGHVCNSHWWYQINEAAQERGATVMLTGEIGNLTISAGGLRNLGDLIRQGRWRRWLREARAIGPMTGASWRGVLAYSFGPWLSRPLWEIAMGSSLSSAMKMGETSLLAPGSANQIHDQLRHSRREARPPKNSRAYRIRLMESMNTGNFRKAALARWGIEERDPTADRRVIEFCLTLPDEMLLRNGVPRPLAREALSDRLPVEVIDNRLRGYQMADWYEQITRQSMCALFEQVKTSHQASAIIDFEKVRRKLETWPEGNMNDSRVIQEYRGRLLRTLATARFIQTAAHAGSVRCQSPQKAACRPGKPIGSLLGFS